MLETEGEEFCGGCQGGFEDQTTIIIINEDFFVDQRLKISETNFISSINMYVLKNPYVNDFFIDLGLCLLASLPTNILFLCFFPFAVIFMPMSQCKGFLHIWTASFIFFQLSYAPSYCHFSFTLQNANNVVILFK